MTEPVTTSLYEGDEWWRTLSSARKAALLRPYFDAEGWLPKSKRRQRDIAIAAEFRIHVSSVALQRSRYQPGPNIELKRAYEERYAFLVDRLMSRLGRVILPVPLHSGTEWWTSRSAQEKQEAVIPLLMAGMSYSGIRAYLHLGSRNSVAGVIDRMRFPNEIRKQIREHRRTNRIPAVRRTMWSLDKKVGAESNTTWHELTGAEDPGFARSELRLFLQALLDKRALPDDIVLLIQQLKLGDDLDEEEYRRLAATIRKHPDLLDIAAHL